MKDHFIIRNRWILIFCSVIAIFMLYRQFFGVDFTDETYYTSLSLRFARGDLPLWQSWDIPQLNAWLFSPLIGLYTKVVGGTTGLILFGRLVYFMIAGIVSSVFVYAFKNLLKEKISLILGATILLYAPFSIYSIGYNNMFNILLLLSASLSYLSITISNEKAQKILLVLTAVSQALTCIVHPAGIPPCFFLIVLNIVFICRKYRKEKRIAEFLLPYLFAGILTVLCFFATILLKTGFNNIISGVSNILNNPVYGQMVGKRNYFDILHSMVIYTWQNIPYNKLILADLFIVLATYKIVPVKFRALYRIGTLALFIACAHNAFNQPAALSVSHMFLNISAFMPVVFFMLSSENIKSAAQLIMYLYLPSWMGYLGITLFSAGTYLQAQQTLLPATISTVGAFCLLFGEQLKSRKAVEVPVQKKIKSIKWAYIPYFGIPVLICISILYLNWSYCYRDVSPAYADTHISTGIYAGLNTSKTTAEIVTSAEKDIRAVTDQYGNGKIQFFECFPAGYAMTNMRAGAQDLFSSTYYLYGNNSVDSIFRYYDKVSGMPDIIVYMQKSLTPPEYGKDSFKNLDDPVYPVQAFINEFYTPVLKTDNYYIFKKAKSGAKFTLENGKYVENALEFKLLNGISCEYEANIAAGTLFEDKNGVRTLQPKGTSGYMNVDLNPGKYKIEISGNNLDGVQYNFTYSNNKNQQKVGEISNASANQNKISYDLQLNKLSNNIAVNINNTTDHTVEITSIKITPQ